MGSIVKTATPSLGFDVNTPMTATLANSFRKAGYGFIIRYLPRTSALTAGNLTLAEIDILLTAGLNIMAVQHTSLPGWNPNAPLGAQYGQYAAQYASEIGLPKGINIWLDLEEVAAIATDKDVINYCHAWYSIVLDLGYIPGLYVGYGTNISDKQLYDLPFKNYWRAYNCDQHVPTRGYQIIQHTQKTLNGITFDPNTIQADELGDLPIWLSPS
jgi:hypothetical protein